VPQADHWRRTAASTLDGSCRFATVLRGYSRLASPLSDVGDGRLAEVTQIAMTGEDLVVELALRCRSMVGGPRLVEGL